MQAHLQLQRSSWMHQGVQNDCFPETESPEVEERSFDFLFAAFCKEQLEVIPILSERSQHLEQYAVDVYIL